MKRKYNLLGNNSSKRKKKKAMYSDVICCNETSTWITIIIIQSTTLFFKTTCFIYCSQSSSKGIVRIFRSVHSKSDLISHFVSQIGINKYTYRWHSFSCEDCYCFWQMFMCKETCVREIMLEYSLLKFSYFAMDAYSWWKFGFLKKSFIFSFIMHSCDTFLHFSWIFLFVYLNHYLFIFL